MTAVATESLTAEQMVKIAREHETDSELSRAAATGWTEAAHRS